MSSFTQKLDVLDLLIKTLEDLIEELDEKIAKLDMVIEKAEKKRSAELRLLRRYYQPL